MRATAYCLAEGLDLLKLARVYRSQQALMTNSTDVLGISFPLKKSYTFFFKQGCVVCWGFPKRAELEFVEQAKNFAIKPHDIIYQDKLSYRITDKFTLRANDYFNVDMITLDCDDEETKLGISYALALSVKLISAESQLTKVVEKNLDLPHTLALTGRTKLSRREILQRLGEIFISRSEVNLKYDYLKLPDFFWRHPPLERYYEQMTQYLDVPRRVAVLNHKLDTLSDTFNLLTNELHHRHSIMLEMIIVILIALEILLAIVTHSI